MAPAAVDAHGAAATRSVPGLLIEQATVAPNGLALRGKQYGRWAPTTWREYAEQVARVAAGLRDLDVSEGDRVAIVADNSCEWLVADLAVQALGATSVGLDPSIEEPELQAILVHTGAIVVVVEDEEQYDKITKIRPDLDALRTLVVIDPRGIALDRDNTDVRTLAQVEAAGSGATVDSLATDLARVTPAHVATLIYERGRPDGPQEAPVTHADLLSAADAARAALGLDRSTEVLSYLPLSLLAERVISLAAALATGSVVCFGDGGDTFLSDMQQVQPTFLLGVPLVFEEIHSTVERRMQDATFLKRRTYAFWMARGRRHGAARRAGHAGLVGRLLYGIGWVVLYRPLRVKLGLLRVRGALCTPAIGDPAVLEFFWAIGVPVHGDGDRLEDGHIEDAGFLHLDRTEAQA